MTSPGRRSTYLNGHYCFWELPTFFARSSHFRVHFLKLYCMDFTVVLAIIIFVVSTITLHYGNSKMNTQSFLRYSYWIQILLFFLFLLSSKNRYFWLDLILRRTKFSSCSNNDLWILDFRFDSSFLIVSVIQSARIITDIFNKMNRKKIRIRH